MYIFNENELPRPIPKDNEKIRDDKFSLYKPRKNSKNTRFEQYKRAISHN